ncbi:growth/differentiation factor 8-like [Trichogramma pretiosum]|uniref:growth/differentiation factor 8-like n=1 Tax=Trichogramma pretiosum TaxID=7493 RepID=UPI0006C9998D|nr:growth/differentiation factor 8-like [Trichogramma pretiosum]
MPNYILKSKFFASFVLVFLVLPAASSWISISPFSKWVLGGLPKVVTEPPTPSPSTSPSDCDHPGDGCARANRELEAIDDLTLTDLRIEYVKQQILKKLRLDKPPDVSVNMSTLPKPLFNGDVLDLQPGELAEPSSPAESFYGKTNQIVLFPIESSMKKRCRHSTNHITGFSPAVCVSYNLPNDVHAQVTVKSAELWFYKTRDRNGNNNHTFVISELDHWDLGGSFEKTTILAIFDFNDNEGWTSIDVGFAVKKWAEKGLLTHSLSIACSTCTNPEHGLAPVSLEARTKPFIVIQTEPAPQRNRPKRESNCQADTKECCREELFISFEDIGWNDWILYPRGYHAYFCKGSCNTAFSLSISGSQYNDVIRRLLSKVKTFHRRNEIVPCCSPTQLSPLQLLYVESNNSIAHKTLPNMVVEACGCM